MRAPRGPHPSMVRGGGWRRKVTPNLGADQEGTRTLNLTVLRRLDPAVADILIIAAHVTAYSFDEGTNQWSRKGVEGSLFVVKRNTQPRFQFIVMNRRNTENFVEDLLRNFEYQVEVPYIMYRNALDEVIGIWFYDPQECEEVAHLFSRIHKAFSRASPEAMVSAIQSDFEEPELAYAVPSAEDTLISALLTAAACVGAPTGGTGAVQPNQSVRTVASSRHASPSAMSSHPPVALHSLPPSRTPSAPVMPPDAHRSTSAPAIEPASLTKPLLFPPITSSQTTMAPAAFSSSALPPFHPPVAIQHQQSAPWLRPFPPSAPPSLHPQHRQSAPLLQPFPPPPPAASLPPPYGAPILQPFPPPNPCPLLAPTACYGPLLSRDKVRGAMLKLVQNDDFIDMVYREIVKGQQ
ncbi:mRNA-decapping enzyme-like protein [Brachypodium distachyon]|uniref:WH1 domain-containing protein n=2 Tax=Brachypodium distachyon TaxID=15368 RepID=A0A0Q3GMB1_BRADI|nr:mRNA-decapping enzyme-like protein [Brachypodium distachyon]KQK12264.1 hypothetical protein BRADI_1g02517v3 [Brachypodium distachyon]|eukprot:XP_003559187.2 mRNA-decapping enzyme-like protein [Brachypodium distachyon]